MWNNKASKKNWTSFLTMPMGIVNEYHVFYMIKVVMCSTLVKVYTLLCKTAVQPVTLSKGCVH
jgi:hypothetical protein